LFLSSFYTKRRYINSCLLAARSPPLPRILSDANRTKFGSFLSAIVRHTFTCLTSYFVERRTNTLPRPSAALASRYANRSPFREPWHLGSVVAVIVPSSGAKDVESTKESPLRVRETPSSHLAFACSPLSPCTPRPRRRRAFRAVTRSHAATEFARRRHVRAPATATYRSSRHDRRGCTPRWQCSGSLVRRPPRAGSPFFSPPGRISRDAQCRAHPRAPGPTSAKPPRTLRSLIQSFILYVRNLSATCETQNCEVVFLLLILLPPTFIMSLVLFHDHIPLCNSDSKLFLIDPFQLRRRSARRSSPSVSDDRDLGLVIKSHSSRA